MSECYYLDENFKDRFRVRSSFQGHSLVATFIYRLDAENFIWYRNDMLDLYNTTDVNMYDIESIISYYYTKP